jgi:hypothetical protein
MTQPIKPERVLDELEAMRKRIETLERTSRLTNASMTDGTLTVYDAAGVLRVQLGKLPNGLYGIRTYNASGIQTNEISG